MNYDEEALVYHRLPRPGKLAVVPTKPCVTQRDLALAYTPGVAAPCLRIADNPDDAYLYTNRGNLVAVVTNGTAVLGLGDIGALAGKPVMEGKGVLFKRFAGVDVYDIELATKDPAEIIRTCEILAPTFGGINLEDIKAPECFLIEEALQGLDIPVFHDDQHGTALISGAALLNAVEIIGKRIEDLRVVFSGAGAAGIACARFWESLGVRHDNIILCDSQGVVYQGRDDVDPAHPKYNPYKAAFAAKTDLRSLADALRDADAFAGLSLKGLVSGDMVKSMAKDPIVFALANPEPEITWEDATAARSDVVMATGRSDYPNQVNNVLGFPFIFRGALDVRARAINEPMKVAAARALADLAKEDVPDQVLRAYHLDRLQFGREYLIPKPVDPRVLTREAVAVARAAVDSGVARHNITDWDAYRDSLEQLLGPERETVRRVIHQAQRQPKRIVFGEGDDPKVLRAAHIIVEEGIAKPILLADPAKVAALCAELGLDLPAVEVVEPVQSPLYTRYVERFHELRWRKGTRKDDAFREMSHRSTFGPMMVREGAADVFVSGRTRYYPDAIRPMLRVVSDRTHRRTISATHVAVKNGHHYLLADTSVNVDPNVDELVEIAENTSELALELGMKPRVAFLSYSMFGSVHSPATNKMREAAERFAVAHPEWEVEGELQADAAVLPGLAKDFPGARLEGPANVLVFPSLDASNIAFRLLGALGDVSLIGPVLGGVDLPMYILQRGASPEDIVNLAAIAVVHAQRVGKAALRK
ncbi:MAG: NADP-dependent malic enzyme [Deltaproteobacteria bacterium HGW-Deltaproteobacteria-14]|jgi:malate dehydrogenase (oxaloacetate-decarboxylating)(NADP+)|nr:MAG: NADP-dependent malic enzyme [Deltaproteobacteria bacterium HGW-Deltaproteobacteria-14]